MTTFIFSGIDDRQFNIIDENGTTIYTVQLPHTTNFLPMNAWDCCKDAFSPKLKVENPLLMSKIIPAIVAIGKITPNSTVAIIFEVLGFFNPEFFPFFSAVI